MINFIIGFLRLIYIFAGVFSLGVSLFCGQEDIPGFVFFICLAVLFFWFSSMLKRRKVSVIKYIIILHSITIFIPVIYFIWMLLVDKKSKSEYFDYVCPGMVWIFLSSGPIYFFTRPVVKKQWILDACASRAADFCVS